MTEHANESVPKQESSSSFTEAHPRWKSARPSRSEFIQIRDIEYHVRRWGNKEAPTLLLLHGWLDVSASYQFLVDALSHEWNIIAPDWCGFGLSGNRSGAYGYADYLADLDYLIDHYSPNEPVYLVAHSMGGNIASIYAGIRPERIARFATLEGFGPVPPLDGNSDRKRVRKWLNGIKSGVRRSSFSNHAEFAERLMHRNPRLLPARASFLAHAFGKRNQDNTIDIAADSSHQRYVGHPRPTFEFYLSCWKHIQCPVLWVAARDSHIFRIFTETLSNRALYDAALASFIKVEEAIIEESGHNMHHDQPEHLAQIMEAFFSKP